MLKNSLGEHHQAIYRPEIQTVVVRKHWPHSLFPAVSAPFSASLLIFWVRNSIIVRLTKVCSFQVRILILNGWLMCSIDKTHGSALAQRIVEGWPAELCCSIFWWKGGPRSREVLLCTIERWNWFIDKRKKIMKNGVTKLGTNDNSSQFFKLIPKVPRQLRKETVQKPKWVVLKRQMLTYAVVQYIYMSKISEFKG